MSRPSGGVLHKTVFLDVTDMLCSSCTAIHGSLQVLDVIGYSNSDGSYFRIFNRNSKLDPRPAVLSPHNAGNRRRFDGLWREWVACWCGKAMFACADE